MPTWSTSGTEEGPGIGEEGCSSARVMLDGIDSHACGSSADSARWTSHGRPDRGLAGRSGDRQLCYNRSIVDLLAREVTR
jgi:hypothetical protein